MLNKKELLNEDGIDTALMLIGFIPVIGEVADMILIIKYLIQGKYLYAGLMLIALLPFVGDMIVKPFLFVLRGRKMTNLAFKSSDDLVRVLETNPKAKELYTGLATHITNPKLGQQLNNLAKVPGGKQAADGLYASLKQHAGILSRITQRPIDIAKSIGYEIRTTKSSFLGTLAGRGPVAMGIRKQFQRENLIKYIQKNGQAPSTWLSHWYHIVWKGRADRREYIKKFIIANNLLSFFGIPSFSSFERKFESDASFREKVAAHPAFANLVKGTTDDDDLNTINQAAAPEVDSGIFKFAQSLSLGLLKKVAQSF